MPLRNVVERVALTGISSILIIDSILKLFPKLVPASTASMDRRFTEYSEVCVTSMFGYYPDPIVYKICVGSFQICSAIGLLFQDLRQMSSVILGVMMLGAIHTFINLKEYSETIFPVILFLTLCYLYGMAARKSKSVRFSESDEIREESEDEYSFKKKKNK